MLFCIIIIAVIIGLFIMHVTDETEWSWFGGLILSVISILAIIIAVIILICNYAGLDGRVAALNTRREMLIYQYENNIYDNDNDLGKRELIIDIQSWNEDLSWYENIQNDFWIGIFIPNIYNQFEPISLERKE